MSFQQAEVLLKEEMKVAGFFQTHTLCCPRSARRAGIFANVISPFRAVFLSLLCTLDTPAPGKQGQEAGACKSHLSVLCLYTSVLNPGAP